MTALRVLFVCTANRCRSPMAEALLRERLAAEGTTSVEVRSTGRLPGGQAATEGAVRAMARRGVALEAHRSSEVTTAAVAEADLVVGMAREHVREVVVSTPGAMPRTFTLKELVRRGRAVGARPPDQPLDEWLGLVGAGRSTSALLGDDPLDDVADPIGLPDYAYEATAVELATLIDELVELAFAHETDTRSAT